MKGQGKKIISLFLICVMMLGVAGPGMEIFAGTTGASVENTEKTVAEARDDVLLVVPAPVYVHQIHHRGR